MRARQLAQEATVVEPTDDLATALRSIGTSHLPGLVVRSGTRYTVVPPSQILRIGLPNYVLDDPTLGRVWDEASSDLLAERLETKHVSDLIDALDRHRRQLRHSVPADATTVEVAAVMAAAHIPLVVVLDGETLVGVVTAARLIAHLAR